MGELAFRTACEHNHLNVVRALLGLDGDRKVDIHAEEDDALTRACAKGSTAVVRELLALNRKGRKYDLRAFKHRAFMQAVTGGHAGIVRMFLQVSGRKRRMQLYFEDWRALRVACTVAARDRRFVTRSRRIGGRKIPGCPHKDVVSALLTAGEDRLPPEAKYAKLWPKGPSWRHWRLRVENRGRATRVLCWRWAGDARRDAGIARQCCEEGRPLELAGRMRRARHVLDPAAMEGMRAVAEARGHGECAELVAAVIAEGSKQPAAAGGSSGVS